MNPESSAFLYAEREEFARALSLTRSEPNSERGIWQPWAYFRLGMYETVASLGIDPCHPGYAERQLLPAILSQAALSRFALVHALLRYQAPWGDRLPTSLRVAVAKHLSSYMPQEAFRLLESVDEGQVPAAVRALSPSCGPVAKNALGILFG